MLTISQNLRLYSLRVLKRSGASMSALVKVYLSIIRPVLEYAMPVWQNILQVGSTYYFANENISGSPGCVRPDYFRG